MDEIIAKTFTVEIKDANDGVTPITMKLTSNMSKIEQLGLLELIKANIIKDINKG